MALSPLLNAIHESQGFDVVLRAEISAIWSGIQAVSHNIAECSGPQKSGKYMIDEYWHGVMYC
eukprot:scaffold20865_cov42-Prasinocladus_malaysianus.AAC.2